MECKSTNKIKESTRTDILVAPYWNVNEQNDLGIIKKASILVAPYWNVNRVAPNTIDLGKGILVAPYWNVNKVYSEKGLGSRAY